MPHAQLRLRLWQQQKCHIWRRLGGGGGNQESSGNRGGGDLGWGYVALCAMLPPQEALYARSAPLEQQHAGIARIAQKVTRGEYNGVAGAWHIALFAV